MYCWPTSFQSPYWWVALFHVLVLTIFIPIDIGAAVALLVVSEGIGIVEELV